MIPAEKNLKVLIVDNDNDILDVMKEALTYEGYEVNSLLEVDNIFPELMRYRPDIVILDYILDGVNGGELCHQIKVNRHTADLPVMIMSAYPKVLQSLGDYGCDVFISKPFDLDHIVASIKKLTADKTSDQDMYTDSKN